MSNLSSSLFACKFIYDNLINFAKNTYEILTNSSSIIVVSESNFSTRYAAKIIKSFSVVSSAAHRLNNVKSISIPAGEAGKDVSIVQFLWNFLIKIGADRQSAIISVGGGATNDCVGFVASTYMRGIKFIQVPTTLLSMVDACVGGKTAINLNSAKNIVGTFYQPQLVYMDIDTLKTLPEDQFLSGYSEAIKLACLVGGRLYDQIFGTEQDLKQIIRLSQVAKADICSQDFYDENTIRAQLNFGHTLAHALEATYKIPHGLAVAIGMDFAAFLASEEGFSTYEVYNKLHDILVCSKVWGASVTSLSPVSLAGLDVFSLCNYMLCDKKTINGQLNYVLLESFGKPIVCNITLEKVQTNLLKYIGLWDSTL